VLKIFPVSLRCWLPVPWVVKFLWLFAIFSLLCSGCNLPRSPSLATATPSPTSPSLALNTLVSSHTLTVGSFTSYMPQEYRDPQTGQLTGFDIDLVDSLAGRLNLHTQVVSTDFSQLIPDLLEKRFDIVVSAVAITPELQKQVSFIPYFRGGESLMVKKGNPDAILRLRDLCGHSVAALNGTFELQEIHEVNANCQASHRSPVTLHSASSSTDALQLLRSGTVNAIYQDSSLTDYFVKLYPQSFSPAGPIINAATEGIVVRKEDTATLNTLRNTFAKLQTDGTYRSLIEKWGLLNGAITASSASSP
jgi:ABC-type amino acid transport/signal transduction systems, periplasmic component/domain